MKKSKKIVMALAGLSMLAMGQVVAPVYAEVFPSEAFEDYGIEEGYYQVEMNSFSDVITRSKMIELLRMGKGLDHIYYHFPLSVNGVGYDSNGGNITLNDGTEVAVAFNNISGLFPGVRDQTFNADSYSETPFTGVFTESINYVQFTFPPGEDGSRKVVSAAPTTEISHTITLVDDVVFVKHVTDAGEYLGSEIISGEIGSEYQVTPMVEEGYQLQEGTVLTGIIEDRPQLVTLVYNLVDESTTIAEETTVSTEQSTTAETSTELSEESTEAETTVKDESTTTSEVSTTEGEPTTTEAGETTTAEVTTAEPSDTTTTVEATTVAGETTTSAETTTSEPKEEKTYTVIKGDTLNKIAKHFGVSVKELKEYNKLKEDTIMVGQTLKIPAAKSEETTTVAETTTNTETTTASDATTTVAETTTAQVTVEKNQTTIPAKAPTQTQAPQLPKTGEKSSLPIIVGAVVLLAGGLFLMFKNKKAEK